MKYLIAIITAVFFANIATACSCGNFNTTEQDIAASDYVALVRVSGILAGDTKGAQKIIVQELALYKGNAAKEIIVDGYQTSCDMGIKLNEEWILFATQKDKKLYTGFCSHPVLYRDAKGYRNLVNGAATGVLAAINTYFKRSFEDAHPVNGRHVQYFPDGSIEYETHYVNGVREGRTRYYYPGGKLNGEEYYRKGKLHNKQVTYYPDGKVQFRNSFQDGTRVDSSAYYVTSMKGGESLLHTLNIYDKQGVWLHTKSYQLPIGIAGYSSYYLSSEAVYDPQTKITGYYNYHANGVVKDTYQIDAQGNHVGDEKTYNDKGKLIKTLRVQKGKPNEIIYIDTTYWPGYRKQ